MSKTNHAENFAVLSGRDQILLRPGMWIGSVTPRSQMMHIISDNKIEYKEITFVPAFVKCINELLDNSIDALISSSQANGKIKVKMTSNSIIIEDNGPGIPVVKKDISSIQSTNSTISEEEKQQLSEMYIPHIAWTRLFSGTNFVDSPDKMTVGAHGIGSKASVIFSTKFIGRTDDGKKSCKVVAVNNLEKSTCTIGQTSGTSGTKVEFIPDLNRFDLTEIEQVYHDVIYQRLLCLAITFPDISFSFNGKTINLTGKKFVSLFSNNIVYQSFDRGFIGIYHNENDEFNFCSYVNGLAMTRGGSHVDYVINQLVAPIRDKLVKKYKEIKPADIRNKLSLVLFMRDFPNAKYDSQTKETLTNAPSEISAYFNSSIDFKLFAKHILKNTALIDPIIETFKLKEEVKNRIALKNKTKNKIKVSADKYISPTGKEQKYFMICEGWSACSGISQALGRTGIGYYASRGVPLSVVDAKTSQIIKNQEFSDIMSILGIDPTNHVNSDINFNLIVHAGDSDLDSLHIIGIYMGWWLKFAPNLFNQNKIARLMTPYVILWEDNKMTKIHKAFYDLQSYKQYEATNNVSKYKKNLFKGLGSWSKEQFQKLFDSSPNGIEDFLQYINLDDYGKIIANNWLKTTEADKRKEYLRQYTLDIEQV